VIGKIQRSQNQTADALVKQALAESLLPHSPELTSTCTNATHDQCTHQEALQFVTLNSVCVFTTLGAMLLAEVHFVHSIFLIIILVSQISELAS
jgi:hypothetical protein